MISVALAGRIAEEIMFDGRVTTGASDDIKKVTQLATGLVTVYGMSPKMGLVGYNSMGGEEQM
jgi:ATP-dependent Zn protease